MKILQYLTFCSYQILCLNAVQLYLVYMQYTQELLYLAVTKREQIYLGAEFLSNR